MHVHLLQDLSLLNRPMERIILMEDHADKNTFQPENAIDVPEFTGDPNDTYLIKMLPFLESKDRRRTGLCLFHPQPIPSHSPHATPVSCHFKIALALSGIDDVRPVLETYRGKDIPAVFAENQRRFAEKKKVQQAAPPPKPRGLMSLLRSPVRRAAGPKLSRKQMQLC